MCVRARVWGLWESSPVRVDEFLRFEVPRREKKETKERAARRGEFFMANSSSSVNKSHMVLPRVYSTSSSFSEGHLLHNFNSGYLTSYASDGPFFTTNDNAGLGRAGPGQAGRLDPRLPFSFIHSTRSESVSNGNGILIIPKTTKNTK